MINPVLLKNSTCLQWKMGKPLEHVYGQTSKYIPKEKLPDVLKKACRACREKLHLSTDKFVSSKKQ